MSENVRRETSNVKRFLQTIHDFTFHVSRLTFHRQKSLEYLRKERDRKRRIHAKELPYNRNPHDAEK